MDSTFLVAFFFWLGWAGWDGCPLSLYRTHYYSVGMKRRRMHRSPPPSNCCESPLAHLFSRQERSAELVLYSLRTSLSSLKI
ncbi:hypothetical protein DAPPUDRAFT_307798 [Daphnia pulex]|uniref:Secreted protein n=1 Tax=Daphnia pulex TaxID=6669 RepID=E9G188_DAPPU|nr:hypothetical protein DAPPUDRAFT_307798 [Daphnia pulex]|eukprot:EFX86627.1 hypothetical protein DAPPUDRAFT_307798 [Daphnia pulex]